MAGTAPSFFERVWLAFVVFFRVVFDGEFARGAKALTDGAPPSLVEPAPSETSHAAAPIPASRTASPDDGALGLLALLQREGRLVDFLEQEVAAFADSEVGAAARVVHDGCRRALKGHVDIVRVREEKEGTSIALPEGFDMTSVTLTGNVSGRAPYRGVLRHSGWRVKEIRLPTRVPGHDASLLAPAEVEL